MHFYLAMHVVLARYCYRKLFVRLSVCPSIRPSARPSVHDVDVPWTYTLGYFENNCMDDLLTVFAPRAGHNIGNLVQRETRKIRVEWGWGRSSQQKTCNISETGHDMTKVTIDDQ